ncbi:MAG: SRPBCC family protein, partial [Reyranella sp.]
DELVLTRDIAAPRARVFAAWTDARAASSWWVPRDFTPLACEMDVRPGGAWHRRMRAPDGTVVTKWGVYREVTAPERLVFTYRTESAGVTDPETLVTLTFTDLGNRTRLTLRHTAFETDAARVDHQGGWTGALERLTTFIATEGAAP